MIGVDTNVLVRLLTADDPGQHAMALNFFQQRSIEDPAFISAVTIAETVWVLRVTYTFTFSEIGEAIGALLDSDDFLVENREAIGAALQASRPELMTDFVVAHLGQRAGCSHTVTFDKRAAKTIPAMQLLS